MTSAERIERDGLLAFVEAELLACDTIGAAAASERWQAIADHLRGNVLVDEGELRNMADGIATSESCWDTFDCPGRVPSCSGMPPIGEIPDAYCRATLLAHFGLEQEAN